MTISFNAIPLDLRSPGSYVEIDPSRARKGLPRKTPRVLLIGPETGGNPGLLKRLFTPAGAATTFGQYSALTGMARAFMAANSSAEVYGFGIADDAGGAAAAGTITITHAATGSGTLALLIGGVRLPIGVVSGDTVGQIAAKIVTEVTAGKTGLPLSAAAVAGVVTLTCVHKGVLGNFIDLRVNADVGDTTPPGVTLTISGMAGGATDPSVAAALAAIGDEPFDGIVSAWHQTANISLLTAEMASRWGPTRMLDGLVFQAVSGSLGTVSAAGVANSPYLTYVPFPAAITPLWEAAAAYAGVILHYGGIDPARPFQTLPLPGVHAPIAGTAFTRPEREALLRDGISTWTVDASGQIILERPITTYQVDAAGNEDPAWLDVNTVLTISYLRFSLRARIAAKYPRHKLADDGTAFGIGQAIVTPSVLRAEVLAWFGDLEDAGLVENVDQFKADLVIERDGTDQNRVNAVIPPDLINQFRVFAAQIQFRL